MHDIFSILMLLFQVLIWSAVFIALLYLIIRRIKLKQEEDFEKREY